MFAIILLPIRTIVKADLKSNFTEYDQFSFNSVNNILKDTIAYQPNDSELLNRIMQKVGKNLKFKIACKLCLKRVFFFV